MSDLAEIQGNVIGGFKKPHQLFTFFAFAEPRSARAWLGENQDISDAASVLEFNNEFKRLRVLGAQALPSATWLNLALTHRGLTTLGMSDEDGSSFSQPFRQGMLERAPLLGDEGPSHPDNWLEPFRAQRIAGVMILAADDKEDLERERRRRLDVARGAGVDVVLELEGCVRFDRPGHEHFGYRDGTSQPRVRGLEDDSADAIALGEFVLGHGSEAGEPSQDGPEWTKNGSFLAFRRLSQDVAGFRSACRELAKTLGWSQELVGAKLVGRYESGAPLERTIDQPPDFDPSSKDPSVDDPSLLEPDRINNFVYGRDASGHLVPAAAHIRKANPRDLRTPTGGAADTRRRRILRRGIPYGDPVAEGSRAPANYERGLLFACYQASLERQFEFIQHAWLNRRDFPLAADGADPLASSADTERYVRIPGAKPKRVALGRPWVTMTGGEYFFAPSRSALSQLADSRS